jgi:hypothetical protein
MLVRGDQLGESARRQVLAVFGYRWTVENEARAREWSKRSGAIIPSRFARITDQEWLREHAFHVVKDGSRLMRNRSHAEPACLAESSESQ